MNVGDNVIGFRVIVRAGMNLITCSKLKCDGVHRVPIDLVTMAELRVYGPKAQISQATCGHKLMLSVQS